MTARPGARKFGCLSAVLGVALMLAAVLAPARPAAAQGLDVEKVFWCTEGKIGDQTKDQCLAARENILDNCTSCHAITPIVKAQKTPDAWSAFLQPHRIKVPDMADADFTEVGKFLKAHYNPQNPVPKLPPELDKLGLPPA